MVGVDDNSMQRNIAQVIWLKLRADNRLTLFYVYQTKQSALARCHLVQWMGNTLPITPLHCTEARSLLYQLCSMRTNDKSQWHISLYQFNKKYCYYTILTDSKKTRPCRWTLRHMQNLLQRMWRMSPATTPLAYMYNWFLSCSVEALILLNLLRPLLVSYWE